METGIREEQAPGAVPLSRAGRAGGVALLLTGLLLLAGLVLLLRLSIATDYLYDHLVKDPERHAPTGHVIVSPADGTVLYVRRITGGVIPEVVKQGVAVPVAEHLKTEPLAPFQDGYLVGIYMNTFGVHVNYVPDAGIVRQQTIFNGPHMDMTAAETRIILTSMIPGLVTARKLLGLEPFAIADDADYVLKSARETLAIEDTRGRFLYVVRIADYYVGKILTWVAAGEPVARGQKLGMITWGSQTDLFVPDSPGLRLQVAPGDYLYGGQSIVATY